MTHRDALTDDTSGFGIEFNQQALRKYGTKVL
jgi:hypothetical protein